MILFIFNNLYLIFMIEIGAPKTIPKIAYAKRASQQFLNYEITRSQSSITFIQNVKKMQATMKVEEKKNTERISSNNSSFANCNYLPLGIGLLAVINNPICKAPTIKNEQKKKQAKQFYIKRRLLSLGTCQYRMVITKYKIANTKPPNEQYLEYSLSFGQFLKKSVILLNQLIELIDPTLRIFYLIYRFLFINTNQFYNFNKDIFKNQENQKN